MAAADNHVHKFETQASFVEKIDSNDIEFEKVVGKGAFGVVSKARWRGATVAVKMIETEEEIKAFKVEVTQLSRVDHPNIVKLYGACTDHPVCLVMEYADGGSLYNVLHGTVQPIYTAGHAMSWALQTAKGVAYLHGMRPKALIHRDLKPANLLLMAGGTELKICDFGTACDIQTYMTNNKGSAAWMAPEVFEGSVYSEKCDVFSWGIILWEVVSRRKPFDEIGGPAFRIMWAVHQGTRPPKIRGLPKPLDALMTRCWSKEHSQRPSMEEVVKIMQPLLQYFQGKEQEPLIYPTKEERLEEPHISMNLLDLEDHFTHNTNTTGNISRSSTISDTIIRAGGDHDSGGVLMRDSSGLTKTRNPEFEKRRRSADLLSYPKDDDDEEEFKPKAAVRKGHQRSNSHGQILMSSTPSTSSSSAESTYIHSIPSSQSSPSITVTSYSPRDNGTNPTHHTTTATTAKPNLSEFDPLTAPPMPGKQRSNSDETTRVLAVTDPGSERRRSGSQGTIEVPPALTSSKSEIGVAGTMEMKAGLLQGSGKSPDKPMRSMSLDQKVPLSAQVNDDIVIPMAYMTLDHHLQPLPPNRTSSASVEIFEKHCKAAQEYVRVQTELTLLHLRKQELAGELDKDWQLQEASFKIIEEFNHLKSEKESLLREHRNLRKSLDLIREQVQRKQMNRRF